MEKDKNRLCHIKRLLTLGKSPNGKRGMHNKPNKHPEPASAKMFDDVKNAPDISRHIPYTS
jgi:hypothetical protein